MLSALEERGTLAPPSKTNTPCSTRFSFSILPRKNWPSLNQYYFTEVSRITACGSLPACQVKYYSVLCSQCLFSSLGRFPVSLILSSSNIFKRPTAARYCTDYYHSHTLKWLRNLTASEWDTDIITQQGDVNWNGQTRYVKGTQHSLTLMGSHPYYHPFIPSPLQVPARSNSFLEGHDENEPIPSVPKTAWLLTFKV